jgi:hypothetical protein
MVGNRVLKRILGTEREKLRDDWGKLYKGRHSFYCSKSIVWMINYKMRWRMQHRWEK